MVRRLDEIYFAMLHQYVKLIEHALDLLTGRHLMTPSHRDPITDIAAEKSTLDVTARNSKSKIS